MAPQRKKLAEYEAEAVWVGGCFMHPTHGVPRRLYQERHGPLPSYLAVCHTCDNPKCILDDHHFVGTWKDNVADAVRKGRHSCFRKGGVRFAGPHSAASKRKIGAASRRMWKERRNAASGR